jgi:hypothetical protein
VGYALLVRFSAHARYASFRATRRRGKADSREDSMPRFRLQYSLATLLLVVTVACMAVALWVTSRELGTLRAESQRYRNESGYLTISDPKKLHVIKVPTTDGDTWRWRLFVPDDRKFLLHTSVGDVPLTGYTGGSGSSTALSAGEHTVSARIARDISSNRVLRFDLGGGSSISTGMEGKRGDWLDREMRGYSTAGAGAGKTDSAEPGQPLELLRLRVMEVVEVKHPDGSITKDSVTPKGSSDGFLIWIEDPDGVK